MKRILAAIATVLLVWVVVELVLVNCGGSHGRSHTQTSMQTR